MCAWWAPLVTPPPARLMEAAQVVSVRASAAGISPELVELAGRPHLVTQPFLELGPAIAAARTAGEPAPGAWSQALRNSQMALDHIESRLDRVGISTEAVFRIETPEHARPAGSLMMLATRGGKSEGQRFAAGLVRALAQQGSLRDVVATATGRLSRKIVEHTGDSGEDYVARDRVEWRAHFRRAAWGGAVVVITALLKFGILALPFAPLWLGVTLSLNYAGNFIFMQLNHYTLPSRQPSMTAAALAKALERPADYDAEIELVAGITRSQVAAVLGNLLVIIPALPWHGLPDVPAHGTDDHRLAHGGACLREPPAVPQFCAALRLRHGTLPLWLEPRGRLGDQLERLPAAARRHPAGPARIAGAGQGGRAATRQRDGTQLRRHRRLRHPWIPSWPRSRGLQQVPRHCAGRAARLAVLGVPVVQRPSALGGGRIRVVGCGLDGPRGSC